MIIIEKDYLTKKGKVKNIYVGGCYMGQLQKYQMFSFVSKYGYPEKEKYYLTYDGFIGIACPGITRLALFIKYDPNIFVYKYSSKDFNKVMGWE